MKHCIIRNVHYNTFISNNVFTCLSIYSVICDAFQPRSRFWWLNSLRITCLDLMNKSSSRMLWRKRYWLNAKRGAKLLTKRTMQSMSFDTFSWEKMIARCIRGWGMNVANMYIPESIGVALIHLSTDNYDAGLNFPSSWGGLIKVGTDWDISLSIIRRMCFGQFFSNLFSEMS